MKKYYILLLFAMLAVYTTAQNPWDGTAATWTTGDGTSANPYLIENGQHLAYLSEQVRNGETYKDKFFKLANDLNMGADSDQKFTPIGFFDEYIDSENPEVGLVDKSKYFLGIFDGNNKRIDNIHIYFVDEKAVGGTGLFACISNESVIKNIGIGDLSTVEGLDLTGGIVGYMKGGLIENCYNEALIIGGSFCIGGIAGVGEKGQILNCYNAGMIKGATNVAGIAGSADKKVTINNCYNSGTVNGTGFYAGGIVGCLYAGSITNCYNIGAVLDTEAFYAQAIVGDTDKDPFVIENCYYVEELSTVIDENEGVAKKTADEMKASSFLATLNGVQIPAPYVADTKNLNNGYPVLGWQITSITGIQSNEQKPEYNIYAMDQSIYIELTQSTQNAQILVADFTGKILLNKNFENRTSVNIANKGIYVVILNINGKQYTSKIIVK